MWDSLCDIEITPLTAVFRLCLSLVLGSLIGVERKMKGQIAGLRTFALISLGATLAMVLSIYVPQECMGLKNGDPGRIAAQVISGIGFLGAGAIIQMKGSVRGLTTAAGIWVSAAIGMTVGVGMYGIAIFATALVIILLTVIERVERNSNIGNEARTIRLRINGIVPEIGPYEQVLSRMGVHLSRVYLDYDYEAKVTRVNLLVLSKEKKDFIPVFDALRAVGPVMSLSLSNQAEV